LLPVGKTVELRTSHRTLSLDAVAQVLREDMLELCYSWRYRFPLRDESGVLVVPYVNEPRLVERARKVVLADLCSGALEATAIDARNPVERIRINPEVWPALDVDFERNAARTESVAFLAIKVSRPTITTAEPLPPPRRDVEGELREWLQRRVASHDPATPYPAEEADWRAAERDLGIDIPRDLFRRLRNETVPKEWRRRPGRPRASASTQHVPNGARRGPYRPRK
jgi:hypothetical protein